MPDALMKIPGPEHPITISPETARIIVRFGGKVVADTRRALSLKEASYPAVAYIPREDADMSLLTRSDHTTHCPYKGDCNYFSLAGGGKTARDAVWTYEHPYPAVAEIAAYLAFYPDRVDAIERQPM